MDTLLGEYSSGIQIWQRGDLFFIRYDAGAHVPVIREDEIDEGEAKQALQSERAAIDLLKAIQSSLQGLGINPYVSNVKP